MNICLTSGSSDDIFVLFLLKMCGPDSLLPPIVMFPVANSGRLQSKKWSQTESNCKVKKSYSEEFNSVRARYSTSSKETTAECSAWIKLFIRRQERHTVQSVCCHFKICRNPKDFLIQSHILKQWGRCYRFCVFILSQIFPTTSKAREFFVCGLWFGQHYIKGRRKSERRSLGTQLTHFQRVRWQDAVWSTWGHSCRLVRSAEHEKWKEGKTQQGFAWPHPNLIVC